MLSSLRILQLSNYMTGSAVLTDGLTALEHIHISGAGNVQCNLGPWARFSSLQSLRISNVTSGSMQFGIHSRLTSLELSICPHLTELPPSLGNLGQLRTLVLRALPNLLHLPDTISQLTSLTALTIHQCDSLDAETITSLANLRTLELVSPYRKCPALAPLQQLRELGIDTTESDYYDMLSPATISALTNLSSFTLLLPRWDQGLQHQVSFPALAQLPRLRRVVCTRIPGFAADLVSNMLVNATTVTALELRCTKDGNLLPVLQRVVTLASLRQLTIAASELEIPEDVTKLTNLTRLSLSWSKSPILPDIVFSLTTLRHLNINTYAFALPEQISRLHQLRVLKLSGAMLCRQVTSLRCLERLHADSKDKLVHGKTELLRALCELVQMRVRMSTPIGRLHLYWMK
jgi:Leucine-rich repeat (LRR) protein